MEEREFDHIGWLVGAVAVLAWSVLWTRTPRLKEFMRELAD